MMSMLVFPFFTSKRLIILKWVQGVVNSIQKRSQGVLTKQDKGEKLQKDKLQSLQLLNLLFTHSQDNNLTKTSIFFTSWNPLLKWALFRLIQIAQEIESHKVSSILFKKLHLSFLLKRLEVSFHGLYIYATFQTQPLKN